MIPSFLNPTIPLVNATAAWLAAQAEATPSGVASLDRFLVIVPTREAGRRLRLALARQFEERGGVIPPRTGLPVSILESGNIEGLVQASELECQSVLAKLILSLEENQCTKLLPHSTRITNGDRSSWSSALKQASSLGKVQSELEQAALLVRDIPAALAAVEAPESEDGRWQDFAFLEETLFRELRELGLEHPACRRVRAVASPSLSENVDSIVLPALADAPPAFFAALDVLEKKGLNIHILYHCEKNDAEKFDKWGCPIAGENSHWGDLRKLNLQIDDSHIELLPDSNAEADAVAEAWLEGTSLDKSENAANRIALGIVDPNLQASISSSFLARGIAVHDPAKRHIRETSLGRLAMLAAALIGDAPDFASLSAFLREADVRDSLSNEKWSYSRTLESLDELQRHHLPRSMADVRHFLDAELKFASGANNADAAADPSSPTSRRTHWAERYGDLAKLFGALDQLLAVPNNVASGSPEHLCVVLARLFEGRKVSATDSDDLNLASAAESLRDAAAATATPALNKLLSPRERLQLLVSNLSGLTFSSEPEEGAIPLLGWLELPWCDEPLIAIAGFNEGFVPSSIVGDPFLPDKVRSAIGLSNNARRFARDAFLFSQILSCRKSGSVRVFLEKINSAGDAMKPSRLLFACSDAILAGRVRRLFSELERIPDVHSESSRGAWKLDLPIPRPAPSSISVTSLSGYLKSPFEWFISNYLGNGELSGDPAAEIPENDFGTLCHEALQSLADPGAPGDSTSEDEIFEYLKSKLEKRFWSRYGGRKKSLVAAVRLQLDSALSRMKNFAKVQAKEAAAGWRIRFAEVELSDEVEGVAISGKADRIDYNCDTGEWRVLDYKTWDNAEKANKAFDRNPPELLAGSPFMDSISKVECGGFSTGKGGYWNDLQLPLYVLFAKADAKFGIPPDASVSCQYLILGTNEQNTKISGVANPSEEVLDAALATAKAAVRMLKAGIFIPPNGFNAKSLSDTTLALFPETGIVDGICENWLNDQTSRSETFFAPFNSVRNNAKEES